MSVSSIGLKCKLKGFSDLFCTFSREQTFTFQSSLQIVVFVSVLWPHHMAYGILIPWWGMESSALAVKVQKPNNWTHRKVLKLFSIVLVFKVWLQKEEDKRNERENRAMACSSALEIMWKGGAVITTTACLSASLWSEAAISNQSRC